FLKEFYPTFDENRERLPALYLEHAMLTFEGQAVQGIEAIVEKFKNLPFTDQVKHVITDPEKDVDIQPTAADSILIVVTGLVQELGQPMPFRFSETFHIKLSEAGWRILNHVFRLQWPAA
ncbi:putative nuclear transport factor 2, partial [Lentithecium fluviatile CBS 122367]